MARSILLNVLTIASSIALMATSAWMISKAGLQPSIAELGVAPVMVRLLGITRGVFRYFERLVSHDLTFRLLARLRVWFYAALEPLAPARLMPYRSGDLLGRVVADVEELENIYLRVIAPPVTAVIIGTLMAIFMLGFDPLLALILPALLLAFGTGLPLFASWLSRKPGADIVKTRAELNAALVDGIQGIADALAYGYESRLLADFEALNQRLAQKERRLALLDSLQIALVDFAVHITSLTVLVAAIPRVDPVFLGTLTLATAAAFEALTPLPQAAHHLGASLQAGERLFEIIDTEPEIRDKNRPSDLANVGQGFRPSPTEFSADVNNLFRTPFTASNVTYSQAETAPSPSMGRAGLIYTAHRPLLQVAHLVFRYQPDDQPALDDLSFAVQPGQWVAVVGPSGAGKSTLANVLLRFWEYESGQIMLDGRDLRDYAPDEVRRIVGMMMQQTHLFNTTIGENIRLARADASEEDVIEAAKQAQIHDFILSLPEGYATQVGERGLNLSGGERQRIALARLLLKEARLLILDEPTAHLDAVTEREVLMQMYAAAHGRTVLYITHRLTYLDRANLILVLDKGRMVERGSHRALLEAGGFYTRLWNMQTQVIVP